MITMAQINDLERHPPFLKSKVIALAQNDGIHLTLRVDEYEVSIPVLEYTSEEIESALYRSMLFDYINKNIPDSILLQLV